MTDSWVRVGGHGVCEVAEDLEEQVRRSLRGLWNGDLGIAVHAVLDDLTFVIDVGPITDEEHLVVRWKADGTYRGGFPGAPAEAIGRHITFTGTDTPRVADGKLAEYWANADSLLFIQQLGVREIPASG
jgi:SnoaL-like polyketide cyclase